MMNVFGNEIKPGLKENRKQFILLLAVNAFVGGMVGMERSILPQFADEQFGIASKTAILSFIVAFGISKAFANYYTGKLADVLGRRTLLLYGWLLAVPVPFLLIHASSWSWVLFANVILGISQGLTWSSTVVMKIDLVGEKKRGLAMGLNEFSGYVAVGLFAFLSGYLAHKYGVHPYPFYLGVFLSLSGLLLTFFWVKDTAEFVKKESETKNTVLLKNVFRETSFKNKTLSSVTQAGLINNLNDGMIWGLLPVFLLSFNYSGENIGVITAAYPTVWGIAQLFTGRMSDFYSKKKMLFWGMLLQGIAILVLPMSGNFYFMLSISVLLGLGTALVYPTFLSAIAQATNPLQRAESIGTFRLWRDLGYAFGAILSGIIADYFGIEIAILAIGMLTVLSSLIIRFRMQDDIQTEKVCIEKEELNLTENEDLPVALIDVRSKEEYDLGHIPGAEHIDLKDLQFRMQSLDRKKRWITVCGKGGGRSAEAAKLLRENGFYALYLCGGTFAFQQSC